MAADWDDEERIEVFELVCYHESKQSLGLSNTAGKQDPENDTELGRYHIRLHDFVKVCAQLSVH